MNDQPELDRYHPSVDTDANNNLRLTFWDHRDDSLHDEPVRILMGPGRAADFLTQLANHVTNQLVRSAQNVAIGNCLRCRNTRLVDVEAPGGRTSRERCPTCGPTYNAVHDREFPARPKIGGGTL